MDKIFINQLCFDCIIGIYPRERVVPQPLCIDLELTCDIRPAAETNNLDKSLNYAAISESVMDFCQQAQAELLEALAEQLWAHLQECFGIQGARLTIHKPQAVPEAASVGISIVRGEFS